MDRTRTVQSGTDASFEGQPYLQQLRKLQHAFPALKSFLAKLANVDAGRRLVRDHYTSCERVPGRCHALEFKENSVQVLSDHENGFANPEALRQYMAAHPAKESRAQGQRRLFILEDMNPDYVDILGEALGVDPLVFAEQMNTWNFSDSRSVPHRGLPSILSPQKSYTLRYYELRTLQDQSPFRAYQLR